MKLYHNKTDILKKVCLTEGLWCVYKIPKGVEYTWVSHIVEDLPDKMTNLSFLPFKYKVASKLNKRLTEIKNNEELGIKDNIKLDEIMNIIEDVLGGK